MEGSIDRNGKIAKVDLYFPDLSFKIVGCAFEVFNDLGGGLSEKVYQAAMKVAMTKMNLRLKEQAYLTLTFKGEIVGRRFFDFIVEEKIVVELKKGMHYSKANIDQVVEYLRMSKLNLAILINFGNEGVTYKRIVNHINDLTK